MIRLSDHLYIEPMGRILEKEREARHKRATAARRSYAAARITRLNSGWVTYTTTANYEQRMSLTTLISRSRQMFRDTSHFKKYQTMCVSNVVGRDGIRLQSRAYKPDREALDRKLNKYVERKFWEWGMAENCSASGKIDWIGYQELLMRIMPRDGAALFQIRRDKNNKFGMTLKQIDVTYLNPQLNKDGLPNGNRIIMSVEVDEHYRPIAYWLTTPSSDLNFVQGRSRRDPVRVPASEIVHIYIPSDDESQTQGIPWAHAAMLDAKNLHGYKEGTIISAREQANRIGFIEQDPTDDIQFQGETDEETGLKKDIEIDNSPGQWNILEPGMRANIPNVTQPSQNHEAFYKSMTRDEAAGLGVNYFSLMGDYAEVNLSSGRLGLNEERDIWRRLHGFVATMFCRKVYHAWLKSAYLAGELAVTPAQFTELYNPTWRGRGWSYMDPMKEIQADSLALENRLTTYTDIFAERGLDVVDVLETMKQEKELFAEYGIEYGVTPKAAPTEKEPDDGEETDELDDEKIEDKRGMLAATSNGNGNGYY